MNRPIPCFWNGIVFTPMNQYWVKQASKQYGEGEVCNLSHIEERSVKSLRHQFACLREVFYNLPEELADRFKNTEAVRKHALIKSGFCHQRSTVCDTEVEALRMAAFASPMDPYALITVTGKVVTVYTAMSQRIRNGEMDKKTFEASKTAVLDTIAAMIGTSTEALASRATESNE